MKKFIIALIAVFALSTAAMAQGNSEKYAIGLRLGGGYGYGVEASFHLGGLPNLNRVELDLGWNGYGYGGYNHNYLYLTGTYQWRWNIVAGLHWYVGPGAALGLWTGSDIDPYFTVGIGGQVGIEYDFDFPLQLSLDFRPMWHFMDPWHNHGWIHPDGGFGVRYRF